MKALGAGNGEGSILYTSIVYIRYQILHTYVVYGFYDLLYTIYCMLDTIYYIQ